MNIQRTYLLSLLIVAASITPACTTSPKTAQFDPLETAAIADENLEPVEARSNAELLSAADEAFRRGNAAQEAGDHQDALRQYNLMLELMIEADVDPSLFYSFRQEFARMFDSVADDPLFFDRTSDDAWIADARRRGWTGTLPMPSVTPKRVVVELDKITKVYPKNFQGGLDRAHKYRPYIAKEFQKAGIPGELAALAMVESQFHPNVRSRAGAVGMWQFMSATGKRYDLRIDRYVDERRDWQKATHAAAQYLRDLYKFFDGDWALAITAYNMGEGGLDRAIAANGGERNLWKLLETPPASNKIHRETKEFYAKLLASAIVMRNPEQHGFEIRPQPAESTQRVTTRDSFSLAAIEKAAELPKNTLKELNPQLIRSVTPPGTYELVVPANSNRTVVAALRKVPKQAPSTPARQPLPSDGVHVVKRGDTLSGIASMYRVALTELKSINSNISPKRLMVGSRLRIPGKGQPFAGDQKHYRVSRGDSLYEIGKRENVSVNDLRRWNNLGNSSKLRIGQVLVVGQSKGSKAVPTGTKTAHVVTRGETAGIIAQKHGVKLDDLLDWNGLSRKSILRVGDSLTLYDGSGTQVAQAGKTIHTVRSGESASTIAAKYDVKVNDLLSWNKLSKSSVLHVGRKLTLYPGEKAGFNQSIAKSNEPVPITHVVKKGQNPSSIAQQYGVSTGDVVKWNNWSKSHVLHVGDEVKIYAQ